MDTEKAFDSLGHSFLISVLKIFGFGTNVTTWIEILLKNKQLCLVNGGTTTQHVDLGRGACHGDPVSAYLFILVLEILFLLIKKHPEIKGIEIFGHCFLYTAFADNTAGVFFVVVFFCIFFCIFFFLKDLQSIENLVEIFSTFSLFGE